MTGRPKGTHCCTCKVPLVDGVNRTKDSKRCQPCNVVYMKGYRKRRLAVDPDFEKRAYLKNPERKKKYQREYMLRPESKIRHSNNYLMKNYGITLADYEHILNLQGGMCAICKQPPNGKKLLLDHCHYSKQVRGILCSRCNSGIGMFKDSKELLVQAMIYISKWHGYAEKAA